MSRIEGRALGRRGFASVELMIVAPLLLLLLLGLVDLVLQMRATYRVERMAGEIANSIAQLDPVTRSGINAVLAAAPSIGGSNIAVRDTSGNDGAIYVTAFRNENTTNNKRLWSLNNYSSGSPPAAVATRFVSDTSPLPGGVIVPSGMQLLAVEVVSQRVRWTSRVTQGLIGRSAPAILYAVVVARPRTATLSDTLP